jgi:hypothetical protein
VFVAKPGTLGVSSMGSKTRYLGLGDMLLLVAALGAGISGARALWRLEVEKPGSYWTTITPSWLTAAAMASSIATPLTLACLASRLRRPRPPRRRLWMQPGAAAMLACTLLFVVKGIEVAAAFCRRDINEIAGQAARVRVSDTSYLLHVSPPPSLLWGGAAPTSNGVLWSFDAGCWGIQMAAFAAPCGWTVAAIWLLLGASGRWRPEGSWIDRLGRLLGVVWIAAAIAVSVPL